MVTKIKTVARQNVVLDRLADRVANQTSGILGMIVWHAVPDLRISEADLHKLGSQFGLVNLPKMGCPADAFRRATSPTSRRGESRERRYLIRPVCDTGEKLVRHVVVERVDRANVVLGHEAVAELVFHKQTAAMSSNWMRHLSSHQEMMVVEEMLREAAALFDDYTKHITGSELTRYIMRQLSEMSHVTVHPNGAVYFLPASRRARLAKLSAFVRALSNYAVNNAEVVFQVVPVLDEPEQKEMVQRGLSSSVQQDLTAFSAEIAAILARPGKPDISVAESKASALAALRNKVQEYAKVLSVSQGELEASISIAQAQAAELIDRATGATDPLLASIRSAGLAVECSKRTAIVSSPAKSRQVKVKFSTRGYEVLGEVGVGSKRLPEGLVSRPECTVEGNKWTVSTPDADVAMLFVSAALGTQPLERA